MVPVGFILVVLLRSWVSPAVSATLAASAAFAGFLGSIVCGHWAKAKARRDPSLGGRGLAMGGLVVGYTSLVLFACLAAGVVTLAPRMKDMARRATQRRAGPPAAMFDTRLVVGAAPFGLVGEDLHGKLVTLEPYRGKVVLLDFWAMWCGPCVDELPNVIAAYNQYHGQGFEIVGVSLDHANEKEKLVAFTADRKMPWPQIYDGEYWSAANARNFGVRSIPFTLLIGRDGKIAAVGVRGPALAPAIEAALKTSERSLDLKLDDLHRAKH